MSGLGRLLFPGEWLRMSGLGQLLIPLLTFLLFRCCKDALSTEVPQVRGQIKRPSTNGLLWSGSNSSFTCTSLDGAVVDDVTAHDFRFFSSNREIDRQMVQRWVNSTTIEVFLGDLRRDMSPSNLSCCLGNVTLDEITIQVRERPKCRVRNWSSMVCTFEPFQLDNETEFMLIYSRSSCSRSKFLCPHPSRNATHGMCHFQANDEKDSFQFSTHCFALRVSTINRPIIYLHVGRVLVDEFVEPNPVTPISVSSVGSRDAAVGWRAPTDDLIDRKNKPINYRVSWTSKWTNASTVNTSDTSIRLGDLIPNTKYVVTIDCIPLRNGVPTGFWSEKETQTFLTNPEVPEGAPRLTPGGFISFPINSTHRNVELFFQPVAERFSNGVIKGYRMNYSTGNSSISADKTSFSILLERNTEYDVTVDASTKFGYNEALDLKPLLLPQEDKKPPLPESFIVIANETDYLMSWSPVENATSYTLYWCNSNARQFSCTDHLQWKVLPPNQTSAEEANLVALSNRMLRFAVSVETEQPNGVTVSSGMLLSNCTYQRNKELKPPHNFQVRQSTTMTSLIAEWSQPDLSSCGERDFPSHFTISYCLASNCAKTNSTLTVGSLVESVEILGLEPDETYTVWIRSCSKDGRESNYVEAQGTTLPVTEHKRDLAVVIIPVVVIVVVVVLIFAVLLVAKLYFWCKEQCDVIVKIPPKYETRLAPIQVDTSCYSNVQSRYTRVMLSNYNHCNDDRNGYHAKAYHANGCHSSRSYDSKYVNEVTEIQSLFSSTASSSVSSEQCTVCSNVCSSTSSGCFCAAERSPGVSGYNVVVEEPCASSGDPIPVDPGIGCEDSMCTCEDAV